MCIRDRDGYGDNQGDGVWRPDSCVTTSGSSTRARWGCPDTDRDGSSDPNIELGWLPHPAGLADAFPNEPTQWEDSDGDGYGDNSDGIDGYAYPLDASQWFDTDRDGYGDNPAGTTPDGCPNINGFSTEDRYGCPDSDLDGFSDPDENWTSVQGADALPTDGTQWVDGDGDGYGDNALGTNPDKCPTKNGNSTRAWLPDPENPQQNTELPSHGCEDKDGDGWADASESNGMDLIKGEYLDTDRDGVGANADYNDDDARCLLYTSDAADE